MNADNVLDEENAMTVESRLVLEAIILKQDQIFASLPLGAKTNLSSVSSMGFPLCLVPNSWHSPIPKNQLPMTPGIQVQGERPLRPMGPVLCYQLLTGLDRTSG